MCFIMFEFLKKAQLKYEIESLILWQEVSYLEQSFSNCQLISSVNTLNIYIFYYLF